MLTVHPHNDATDATAALAGLSMALTCAPDGQLAVIVATSDHLRGPRVVPCVLDVLLTFNGTALGTGSQPLRLDDGRFRSAQHLVERARP